MTTDFCLQIFVYNGVFWKNKKQYSQKNLLHFENESTFRKRNHSLEMKVYSETHFENENLFSEK